MAVTPGFEAFVVEQLERVAPITTRRMFGGVGIYSGGLIFALLDDDRIYFKVNDDTRPHFEREGMEAFRPGGEEMAMGYYELPPGLIEDEDQLREWVNRAIGVSAAAKSRKRR